MNKIISQYILREIFTTWLGVTLILLIVLITNKFAGVISDIASGDILSSSLLPIIALSSIEYLVILLPLSTFLSVIIVIGRFYRDHEMTAIQVAGKGTGFIYRIFLFPLIVLIGLLAFISIVISPNAKQSILLNEEAAMRSVGIEFFEPGRFVNLKDGSVFYAQGQSEQNRFIKVFLQKKTNNKISVITSEYAEIQSLDNDANRLVFFNGQRYEGKPGTNEFRVLRFNEHKLPLFFDTNGESDEGFETKSFNELILNDSILSKSELQWRLSPPIALIILVLLAVPLSKSSPREGQYGGLVIGVLIYLVYVNLLGAAKVWFEQGDSPMQLGMWWVHGCFAAFLAVYLFSKSRLSRVGR